MTIAGAIFLIAVGAILRYATNFDVKGVSVDTVGLILMIAGAAGLVLSFFWEAMWSDRARARRGGVVEERVEPPVEERVDPSGRRLPPRY
jgi:hypothetical protein